MPGSEIKQYNRRELMIWAFQWLSDDFQDKDFEFRGGGSCTELRFVANISGEPLDEVLMNLTSKSHVPIVPPLPHHWHIIINKT